MTRLLLLLSFISITALNIGRVVYPHDILFWFASVSLEYQIVRAVLAIMLFILLVTKPPRNVVIRTLFMMVALAIGSWTLQQTMQYHMPILDTMLFSSSSIAILVVSLEVSQITKKSKYTSLKPV